MSQENVEIVRGFFEAMIALPVPLDSSTEEIERVEERWTTPEIEYREDPRWPGSGVFRGRAAVREAFLRYTEVFPDMRGEVESVRDAGEAVVALVHFHGRAAGSGVPIDHLWAYVCTVENGRLSSFHAYWDPAEALKAAGLSE